MLWRRRRQLLAVAHVIATLGLIPGFALLVWSVSDGPAVLAALGIHAALPPVKYSDAGIAPFFLGVCIGALRVNRLIYDLRERAILGDGDAIPPARPLAPADAAPPAAPITLIWWPTRRDRIIMMVACFVSLATVIGLGALVVTGADLYAYLFSLQGAEFRALASVLMVAAFGLALIPLAFLRAALRGPRGVVADSVGMRAWRGRRAIAWADARLLEVAVARNRGAETLTYTLYSGDGRSLRWMSRADKPRYISAHTLIQSEPNDSEQRAAAIVTLADTHAGLTPRTFDGVWYGQASKLAAPGAVYVNGVGSAGLWSVNLLLLLGYTCGCGVVTLLFHSSLMLALALVCVAMVALSTLWSLLLNIRDALRMPRLLTRDELPSWRPAQSAPESAPTQLWQTRNRLRNWAMTTRAALLLIGSAAGLAVIISSLVAGPTSVDGFLTWASVTWLASTLLFMGWRVAAQFDRDRVRLLADATGLRNLRAPSESPTPWADFTSLRFTWSREGGFHYTATTRDNDEFTWASQSRLWRDEAPDPATAGIVASPVDGDAFAAIVAARTGLTPAQELA